METPAALEKTKHKPTLNRTIVGWKQEVIPMLRSVGNAFKSHHSGMETAGIKANDGISERSFKSHHSGMETATSSMG